MKGFIPPVLFAALAAAAPNDLVPRAKATCEAVHSRVAKSSCQVEATAYCSSYLGITTITQTQTTTTSTSINVQTTSSAAATQIATITSTVTVTNSGGSQGTTTVVGVPSQCYASGANGKRAPTTISKPSCIKGNQSAKLSSECSCLSLTTPTLTVIVTATASTASTDTIGYTVVSSTTVTSTTTVGDPATTVLGFFIQGTNAAQGMSGVAYPGASQPFNPEYMKFVEGNCGYPLALNEACFLVNNFAGASSGYTYFYGGQGQPILAENAATVAASGVPQGYGNNVQCTLDPDTNALSCNDSVEVLNYYCGSAAYWYMGVATNRECFPVDLVAQPVCSS